MIRGNLGMAMQGLAVVPLFAGFDLDAAQGRIFSYDVDRRPLRGARPPQRRLGLALRPRVAEEAVPPGLDPPSEAVSVAVEALFDAADDDSATGGPDLARRIWPTVGVVDEAGARFVPEDEIAAGRRRDHRLQGRTTPEVRR